MRGGREASEPARVHDARVSPDGRYLFGIAAHINRVFVYALPDLTLAARIPKAKPPDLVWFTPDGNEA